MCPDLAQFRNITLSIDVLFDNCQHAKGRHHASGDHKCHTGYLRFIPINCAAFAQHQDLLALLLHSAGKCVDKVILYHREQYHDRYCKDNTGSHRSAPVCFYLAFE